MKYSCRRKREEKAQCILFYDNFTLKIVETTQANILAFSHSSILALLKKTNMKKHNYYILILLTFLISACGTSEKKANDNGGTELSVFRYNQPSSINSLDPAFSKDQATMWIGNQLFNSLVQIDENLNILPSIAESWETSTDGLTYTFKLRKDVKFHPHELFKSEEERLLTANDVVYSFNRILDPKVASPGAWIFSDKVNKENAFTALNDYTFQLKLTKPFRPVLGILSMQYCSVVSKKVAEHYAREFRSNPIGSGPFKLKKWKEGEMLILEKNEDYWESKNGQQLPLLDGVKVSFNENKQAAYLDFMQGKLDLISGIDPSYKDDLLTPDGTLKPALSSKITLDKSPYLNTEYLVFLMDDKKNPALKDKRIRQAINYGFDREKMIRFLRNNIGVPATAGFVPKGLPSFNPSAVKGYTYNPDKARELIKAAGYSNANPLPEILLETTSSYIDLCTFIQKQLKDIGINVRLEQMPPASLREKISKSESNFFRASWIADYPDAESFLTILYGPYPAPPNYTRFDNPKFNELYQAALLENDNAKRYALYNEMDNVLIEEAPVVPLFYDEVLRFKQKSIKGLKNNAMNMLILKEVSK